MPSGKGQCESVKWGLCTWVDRRPFECGVNGAGPSIVVAEVQPVRTQMLPGHLEQVRTPFDVTYMSLTATLRGEISYLPTPPLGAPPRSVSAANPKGLDPDPLVANANTFEREDLLLYTALVDGRCAHTLPDPIGTFRLQEPAYARANERSSQGLFAVYSGVFAVDLQACRVDFRGVHGVFTVSLQACAVDFRGVHGGFTGVRGGFQGCSRWIYRRA
eukprot:1190173-Prorocentrum_minimum.AAC.1